MSQDQRYKLKVRENPNTGPYVEGKLSECEVCVCVRVCMCVYVVVASTELRLHS